MSDASHKVDDLLSGEVDGIASGTGVPPVQDNLHASRTNTDTIAAAAWIRRLQSVPALFTSAIEGLFSGRGLAILYLLFAMVLGTVGWLHPPLSPDVQSIHIPLGIWQAGRPAPEEILYGPRQIGFDRVGIVLACLLAAGLIVVVRRPRWTGRVAGLLLCMTIAGNAAAALNHPGLVILMDLEFEQRQQIVEVVNTRTLQEDPMALRENYRDNGRVGAFAYLHGDEQRGDMGRGWFYLFYGKWLVVWSAAGVVVGGRGPLRLRLRSLLVWSLAGGALAAVVCCQRLQAEFYWIRAKALEGQCLYGDSRESLRKAVAVFPEFDRLERTWLLAGKLDFREKRFTPQELFFRAYQMAREKNRPRVVAYSQDLPWIINRTIDYREGQATPPGGPDLALEPGIVYSGTSDHRLDFGRPSGAPELAWSKAYMDDLLAGDSRDNPAVRDQAARLWTDIGLNLFLGRIAFEETGRAYMKESGGVNGAQDMWRQAVGLVPFKLDCHFYLGFSEALKDSSHPERVEAEYGPLLRLTADDALRADVLSNIGDALFDAGQLSAARRRYAQSFDTYNMPQVDRINYRAQRRLGGL